MMHRSKGPPRGGSAPALAPANRPFGPRPGPVWQASPEPSDPGEKGTGGRGGRQAALAVCRALILFAALAASCSQPSPSAILELSFSDSGAKTIFPAGLSIDSVQVEGSGPGGLAAVAGATAGQAVALELAPGPWTFLARGFTALGIEVAAGSLDIDLAPGARVSGSIVLVPISGKGSISLSWSIRGQLLGTALVEGLMRGPGGVEMAIGAAADSPPLLYADLESGPWSLELRLIQDGTALCGLAEGLFVAAGMLTEAALVFEPPAAAFGLNLVLPAFGGPAEGGSTIGPLPPLRRVAPSLGAFYRADAPSEVSWYFEGENTGIKAQILSMNAPSIPGSYRLDCVTNDGTLPASGSARLRVGPECIIGPLSWAETIAKEDAPASSPSSCPALADCRDLAFSPASSLLAAVGRDSNAVTVWRAQPRSVPGSAVAIAGGLFVLASMGSQEYPDFLKPSRLRFVSEEVFAVISEAEGALYILRIEGDSISMAGSLRDPLLAGAADLIVSPDQASLYISSVTSDSISIVGLGLNSAPLSFASAAAKGTGGLATFSGPSCLALDASGTRLAAGTTGDDALYIFSRDAVSGALALLERIDKSAFSALGSLSDPCSLAFSPAGDSLYVLSYYGKAVFRLDREPGTGSYLPVAAAKSGLGLVSGFAYPKRLALSPDGSLLALVGGGASDGLALFSISSPAALAFLGASTALAGEAVPSRPSSLAFAPDGSVLALCAEGRLSLFAP